MIDEIGKRGREQGREGGLLGGEEDIDCNVVKSQILVVLMVVSYA